MPVAAVGAEAEGALAEGSVVELPFVRASSIWQAKVLPTSVLRSYLVSHERGHGSRWK